MTNRLASLPHCGLSLNAEGFYPVQGNRWKRGDELYLPLYEGKMVQAFDHRAASVRCQSGQYIYKPYLSSRK